MEALKTIGWFIALLVTLALVYEFIGYRSATMLFPEGKRWWHLPAQLVSLALFAWVVLSHPFGSA